MTQDFFCLSGSWVNHSKNKFFCLNHIPKPKGIIKLLFSLKHTSNSETPYFTWFLKIQNFLFPFRCKLYLEFWLLSGQRGNKIIVTWCLIHFIDIIMINVTARTVIIINNISVNVVVCQSFGKCPTLSNHFGQTVLIWGLILYLDLSDQSIVVGKTWTTLTVS